MFSTSQRIAFSSFDNWQWLTKKVTMMQKELRKDEKQTDIFHRILFLYSNFITFFCQRWMFLTHNSLCFWELKQIDGNTDRLKLSSVFAVKRISLTKKFLKKLSGYVRQTYDLWSLHQNKGWKKVIHNRFWLFRVFSSKVCFIQGAITSDHL